MSRIVIASNRVADLSKASQAGGVAIAIADTLRARKGLWLGWSGQIGDRADELRTTPDLTELGGTTIATLPLSAREHDEYYTGYSNNVLWPVFHSRLDIAQFEAGYYQRYLDVNKRFAQALRPLLKPDDTIWVHDYHMIPLGMELRALGVTNPIGFFLHIPVPPAQTFLAIPEHRELARGLASYDLIGLQTKVDVGNLIDYLQDGVFGRILQDGRIRAFDRELSIASFPVGIDVDSFIGSRSKRSSPRSASTIRLLGVDRLDYTKGLRQRLRAFGEIIRDGSIDVDDAVFVQVATPSRERVDQYRLLRDDIDRLVGRINGDVGRIGQQPITYLHASYPREEMAALYRAADVMVVTPLRDGMNLVAKEYVACRYDDDGALVLSEFAGAAAELRQAYRVNPYDINGMKDALLEAIQADPRENARRMKAMRKHVVDHDIDHWATAFLDELTQTREAHDKKLRPAGGS
jgi:trehalose 6-phosphate synthase